MPELTDNSAEAQPLKEESNAIPPGKVEEEYQEGRRFAHLSRWRTAAFFLSLFLCLTVVFAFSFIIPCPVRPVYLRIWNQTYADAATYNFLAVEDANKDKILDVVFVLKASVGSLNTSCTSEDSPCLFFSAAAGTNGQTLWERALTPEFHWAQCGLRGLGGMDTGCLIAHSQQLTAIDKHTGTILWQQPHLPSFSSQLPVLMVPDLDGDGLGDLVLVGPGPTQTKLRIVSSKMGSLIGSDVVLDSTKTFKHLMHTTASGSHYLLFQTGEIPAILDWQGSGLYAQALWKVAAQARAGSEAGLKRDQVWEKKANDTTGQVLLYSSESLQQVVQIPKESRSPNLLLVSAGSVELVDGDRLQSLWRVNISRVLSEPTTGYFNKDDVPDVVIEDDSDGGTKRSTQHGCPSVNNPAEDLTVSFVLDESNSSADNGPIDLQGEQETEHETFHRVMILDGNSGALLWDMILLIRPNTPVPTSIRTIHTISVFVFWGEMPSQQNSSSTSRKDRFIYMLHPQQPCAVLENSAGTEHIVSFRRQDGLENGVMLTKRKLKEDVPSSRVCWLGDASGNDQAVKAAFDKLRFRQNT
ncbi:ITFG3 protein-like [Scleropages formosus]|uniref:ITFG3 protein-like n=1 Tax=Scleropages formosus TaxID=113540 RepID=A0A0P7UQG5_SCLFO|nr:ITFG3 protein-like [Scleropages formosus]